MTKRNLNYILNPKTIALVGATDKPNSVGEGILTNLTEGGMYKTEFSCSFKGKVFAVNPNRKNVLGMRCYKTVKDIPGRIDLAIIAIPAKFVLGAVEDCVQKKVKGAIIISAGFGELGEDGKKLQKKIASTAKKGGLRIVGPNCLGIIRTQNSMNASFAPSMPPQGNIAFISQSGAIIDSIIDWAIEARYGFSTIVSYGNKADLDIYDFLEWLEKDKHTKAIALYVEGIDNGRKFMKIAKKVNLKKPIIIIKGGRTSKGAKAINSHTGSLAGSYEVYKAAFKQSGLTVAETVEEMLDYAKALATQPPCDLNNIGIITNAGGCGVLCADACEVLGVNVAELEEDTLKKLDASGKMHPAYSRHNPLDIIGDAHPERYEAALKILLEEKYIGGAIVIQTLQTTTDSKGDAEVIIKAAKKYKDKPIICTYMGGKFSREGIELLESNGIPDFNDLAKSAKVMKALVERADWLKRKGR